MIPIESLQVLIYAVFIFSIIAYATLDGFDLGVGCLHLFAKGDNERRLMINAIGPVWDGNTTWIVIGGGVLFAGFPKVFASMMAGFYTPVMLFLFGIIVRGVAVEFRSKKPEKAWRYFWDYLFFFTSFLVALNIGVALGDLIQGFPLNEKGEFRGTLSMLLTPYSFLIGLFGITLFMMHGSIYLLMKTEGELHKRLRIWVKRLTALFLLFWFITSFATFRYQPHMIKPFFHHPWLTLFALFSILCILAIPRAISHKKDGIVFIFSSLSIVFLLILFLIGTFPNLLYSSINPDQYSLTLFNASASRTTLLVLSLIALIGAPLSFFYFSYIYRVFRGKIKLDHMSY
jgi:cytochrome d ubiquinol oxidase subunit II